MAKANFSTKRLMIDKANTTVVVAAGLAAFIFIFSGVAVKTLIGQMNYQNKVIGVKRTAVNQLKADISATETLKTAYDKFNSESTNVIGGNRQGQGAQDGANSKIVLDALPSTYDFPALATSLEKLITSQNLSIDSIAGVDDQLAQAEMTTSATPAPTEIPFTAGVSGGYAGIQNLVSVFEKSIRPISIQTMSISGDQSNLTMTVGATTYYQSGKSLNIKTEVVK